MKMSRFLPIPMVIGLFLAGLTACGPIESARPCINNYPMEKCEKTCEKYNQHMVRYSFDPKTCTTNCYCSPNTL